MAKEEAKELQVIDKRVGVPAETLPAPQESDFLTIFRLATEKNYTPEFISQMMDLRERHEATEARKAYTKAMAEFKKNPPEIDKDQKVSYQTTKGLTEYSHASLANVTTKINSALGGHGLSAAWVTVQNDGSVTVTCTITHELGHSESTSLTAAPDTSGSKNAIQAIGSTISYLERYTILALTGLATHDMDTDAGDPVEYVDEKQLSTIRDLLNALERKWQDVFLAHMKIESEEQILAKDFDIAVGKLKTKIEDLKSDNN